MRQVIERSVFDWTRNRGPKVQARGAVAVAMFSQRIDAAGNIKTNGSTRCVWSDMPVKTATRYLTRRVWTN